MKQLYKSWKTLSVAIKPAIIIGVFTVLASITPILGKLLERVMREFQKVQILEIRSATASSKPVVEIILWNKSDITMPVTSIELSLSQSGLRLADVGASIYELHGTIKQSSVNMENIAGTVSKSRQSQKNPEIITPLLGFWSVWRAGGWKLVFRIPIVEEIPSNGSYSILLVLPDTLNITQSQPFEQLFNKTLIERFVSKDRRKFLLAGLLQYAGPIGLSAEVGFANRKTSTYQGRILFEELGIGIRKRAAIDGP